MDFTINLVDNILVSNLTNTVEFKEYCNDLNELGVIVDPEYYLEAVENKKTGLKRELGKITKNTADTTKKVGSIFNDVTDAGGGLIKGGVDILGASIRLIVKIIKFITDKIMIIPKFIVKVIDNITNLPDTIKNKIKGNITLYITINDIQDLYSQSLMNQLMTFISQAYTLSQGELWGTFFHRRKTGSLDASVNDKKLIKEMEKNYNYISNLGFTKSVINMSNMDTINAYFGNAKSVKFIDHTGKRNECTYYEALIKLSKDLGTKKEEIEQIRVMLSDKLANTQANQEFVKVGPNVQKYIYKSVQMVSKIVEIIGNIIKYIITDMNTIEKITDKLLAKKKINADNIAVASDKKKRERQKPLGVTNIIHPKNNKNNQEVEDNPE